MPILSRAIKKDLVAFIENAKGKHAIEFKQAFMTPTVKCFNDNFGIRA